MIKPTWAERKVIECVGIPADEASDHVIGLARIALERCYYIQHAADWLDAELNTPPAYFFKRREAERLP